jgi:hypothetical protein
MKLLLALLALAGAAAFAPIVAPRTPLAPLRAAKARYTSCLRRAIAARLFTRLPGARTDLPPPRSNANPGSALPPW